ncbi:MAG: NUDIX hydrolase [Campylobacterota bacterium]
MIVNKHICKLSSYFTYEEKTVNLPHFFKPETFHSVLVNDYVCAVVFTKDYKIPLVRQYRPAVEDYTFELPGGLLESNENVYDCIIREVEEEVGLLATRSNVQLLAKMLSDTGRINNRLWAFKIVDAENKINFVKEEGIDIVFVSEDELKKMVEKGKFNHALHIAVLFFLNEEKRWI